MGVPAVFCLFACLFYLGGGRGGERGGKGINDDVFILYIVLAKIKTHT